LEAAGSDGVFEVLGCAKSDLFAGLDFDRLARRGVPPAHPGGAFTYLKVPSPAKRMRSPFYKCLANSLCACRKSDSHVVMVEAAEDGDRGDLAELLGWPANG
jgi:hypothetical protein